MRSRRGNAMGERYSPFAHHVLGAFFVLSFLVSRVFCSDCVQESAQLCRCQVASNDELKGLLPVVGGETELLVITGAVARITNGTFTLANLAKVTRLTLDHVRLSGVDDGTFSGLPQLAELSMADNALTALIGVLPKTLKKLNLENNHFTRLPRIGEICLKELNLRDNKIIEIRQSDIAGLDCLSMVDLAENDLKFVQAKFPETLLRLDLSDNDISWKSSIVSAAKLTELVLKNADYPQTDEVRPLCFMPSLARLDLSASDLYRMPDSISDVNESLNVLKLSNNPLEGLGDDSYSKVENMKELYLDSCQLQKFVGTPFSRLKDLTLLDLSDNDVRAINETFLNSTSVQRLILRNSRIAAIKPGAFRYLPRLKTLDLSRNLLEYVHPSSFENLENVTMDLSSNPVYCDCYVRNIRNWIRENDVNMTIFCGTPTKLASRPVVSLKDTDLDCRPPAFQDCCIRTVNAYENSNITIHFQTDAKPYAQMSYRVIDGDPLPANKSRYTPTKHTVMIDNVTVDNSGNFSCTASNEFGRNTIYVSVNVLPGNPVLYKLRLAEIIVIVIASAVLLFSVAWLCVFVCSKNKYFVYRPWVDDDGHESSYGSIQIRR